eukprot:scaffold9.g3296.t1
MAEQRGTCVLLRVRPPNQRELEERGGAARCVEVVDDSSLRYVGREAPTNATFSFDRVLGEGASQEDVFEEVADVVRSVLAGYNGTVLAFGQTGSGKTHTLLGEVGEPAGRGVVPRAVAALAGGVAARGAEEPGERFRVSLSVVEIYCERVKDLLQPENDNLQVVQDKERGTIVQGATEVPVASEAECVALMRRGIAARAVSATAMNAGSSRSHCVVTLEVERSLADGGSVLSKLCLVGSLGGTARTALIVCCSPSLANDAETLSSLRFGSRARGMRSSVAAGAVRRTPEQLARLLAAARAEADALRARLDGLGCGGGGAASAATGAAAEQRGGGGGAQRRLAAALVTVVLQAAGLVAFFIADEYLLSSASAC